MGAAKLLCRPGLAQTPFVEPVRSYVICCVQRTGSWLLAHTLADTGYAGRPSDYFDDAEREKRTREWGVTTAGDLSAYVSAMRDHATTPNGVASAVADVTASPPVNGIVTRGPPSSAARGLLAP